jgi:predicted RNase H-like nuclease (RuvC/YqgF family)
MKTLAITGIGSFTVAIEDIAMVAGHVAGGGPLSDLLEITEDIKDESKSAAIEIDEFAESVSGLADESEKIKEMADRFDNLSNAIDLVRKYTDLLNDREYDLMTDPEKLKESQKRIAQLKRDLEDQNIPIEKRIDLTRKLFSEEDKLKDLNRSFSDSAMGIIKDVGALLAGPFIGTRSPAEMKAQKPLTDLQRHGAGGGSPIEQESMRLTKRQVKILEKSQATLDRIANKELGGSVL